MKILKYNYLYVVQTSLVCICLNVAKVKFDMVSHCNSYVLESAPDVLGSSSSR